MNVAWHKVHILSCLFLCCVRAYLPFKGLTLPAFHLPSAVDGDQISPAEVCVLDCIMNGGEALSVKGSFVHQLPDISMLLHTLTYVNISYNNFTVSFLSPNLISKTL